MLSADQMLAVYREAKELRDIHVVVFTGGEPTLLADELFDAISAVSLEGVLTRIVTNACWADTDQSAQTMIRDLREAGLDEINFSMDDYHRVWVPLENVARAYHAAKGAGFSAVVLAVAEGPKSRVGADWIRANIDPDIAIVPQEVSTRSGGPAPSLDGTVYEVSTHGYTRVGRARRMRDDLVIPDPLLSRQLFRCTEVMDVVVINSNNEVGACCGIQLHGNPVLTLGSLDHETFEGILEKGFQDHLLQAIRVLGPKYLLDLARMQDPTIEPRPFYCHICEICEDVTRNPRVIAALSGMEAVIVKDIQLRMASVNRGPQTCDPESRESDEPVPGGREVA